MPEPISLLLLAGAKIASIHAAHAAAAQTAGTVIGGAAAGAGSSHLAALLLVGVAAGSVLYAICKCLERLVEAGVFSQKQAEAYKARASSSDEKTQKLMLQDAEDLCRKWGA